MFGVNYKMWVEDGIAKKTQEYLKWLDVNCHWEKTVTGYASVTDERFDTFYGKDLCNHPKRMYRPGNTVIVHFTQILPELVKQYKEGQMSQEEWEKLCLDTNRLSRGITDSVMSTFQGFGREVSLLPESENWSHVCGAEITGLGSFEKREAMFWDGDKVGCMGAVITEVIL